MIFPPSGWQEAHLALKIASAPVSAAEAADASITVASASVAMLIPLFIVHLLCYAKFPSVRRNPEISNHLNG
jgi:hypothetical protein